MSSAVVTLFYFFPLSLLATAATCYAMYAGWFWVVDLASSSWTAPAEYLPFFGIFLMGYLYVGGLALYYVHHFLMNYVLPSVNLKKKYGCKWAIVTGASSGIGKALAMKLASQGINVVGVALQDELFAKTQEQMRQAFPAIQFRFVGCDLGDFETHKYFETIEAQTADLPINVAYLNAGYIKLGGYSKVPLAQSMRNMECNVMSAARLCQLFMSRMRAQKLHGLVCFTSSAAAMFPAPAQAMYSAGKAFLSNFAASLAIEAAQFGIDVMCIHPGPMNTRFYETNVKLDAFKFFLAISATPETVAEQLIGAAAGRVTLYDQGTFTFFVRSIIRLVDMNAFVSLMKHAIPFSGDFKKQPDLL